MPYLEDDGRAGFLLQDPGGAERLEVRVGVVQQVGVVVDEQRLHVVEDEAELVGVLHRVQARVVLGHEGGGEAAHAGGVQHFTHLRRKKNKLREGEIHFVRRCWRRVAQSTHRAMLSLNIPKCDSVIQDKQQTVEHR